MLNNLNVRPIQTNSENLVQTSKNQNAAKDDTFQYHHTAQRESWRIKPQIIMIPY
jgi:hypothetical protein